MAVHPYEQIPVFALFHYAAVGKRHLYGCRIAFVYGNERLVYAKLGAFLQRG